jgi:hydrogenase maturation protease
MTRRFVHREYHPTDPAFMREERRFLDREWAALRSMRFHRDELAADIERCLDAPELDERPLLVLVGIGHSGRGDDAAGIQVAHQVADSRPLCVKVLEDEAGVVSLVRSWAAADDGIVVEAIRSGARVGTVRHFVLAQEGVEDEKLPDWTGDEIAEALEFARSVDHRPRRLTIYGIEGQDFEAGEGLTEEVESAVNRLATVLSRELSQAERIVLPDAGELLIRPIRAADRDDFMRSFQHLSEETRYERFLGPIRTLTEDQVTYFTEVDHHDHEALVALTPEGEIVGIARYIRLPEEAATAEVAVTVADAWQHRGIGYALLERLVRRARAAGVSSFRAICLSRNVDIQQLLREFSSDTRTKTPEPGVVELETTLPAEEEHSSAVRRALSVAARAFHGASPAPRDVSAS